MKKDLQKILGMTALLLAGFAIQSCEDQCEETVTYTRYDPVYLLPADLRAAVGSEAPRVLAEPGKIYRYGNWVLVNEHLKGIHVIDNTNPALPQVVSFINLPGNVDMAIKDGVLFADSYIDLVCIDLSDPTNVSVLHREENAFPWGTQHGGIDPDQGILVDWVATEVTETRSCTDRGGWVGGPVFMNEDVAVTGNSGGGPRGSSGAPSTGIGGSMARFTLSGDYLYVVGDHQLMPFSVQQAGAPQPLERIDLGWGIETIFPYNNHLFIGSQTGMQIFGLANPAQPNWISTYSHLRSCDPVVVQGNYAYVTLRNDNAVCGGFANQLEVIDISNLAEPTLMRVYPMTNPYGLGIDGSCLFVCEGDDGLRYLDASNPLDLQERAVYSNMNAYDVIPYDNLLLAVGADGLYQYSYDCEGNPELLSVVPIIRPN